MAKRKGDREQLSLFETPAKRAPRRVAPAAVDPLDAKSAAALPASIRLGTSSWSFTGWEGLVYDRKAKQSELSQHGLEAYGKHPLLRAVGIDRSYYAPVPRSWGCRRLTGRSGSQSSLSTTLPTLLCRVLPPAAAAAEEKEEDEEDLLWMVVAVECALAT